MNNTFVTAGGQLEEGWVVHGTMRTTGVNSGRLDMTYISPEMQRFRSQKDVLTHLGLGRPASSEGGPARAAAPSKEFDSARARGAKIQARAGIAGAPRSRSATHVSRAQQSNAAMCSARCAASTMGVPVKRKDEGAAPSAARAAMTQRAAEFRESERRIRAEADLWRSYAFPLSDADRARVAAAEAASRDARVGRARRAASYGVVEFAGRMDSWLSRCARYHKVRTSCFLLMLLNTTRCSSEHVSLRGFSPCAPACCPLGELVDRCKDRAGGGAECGKGDVAPQRRVHAPHRRDECTAHQARRRPGAARREGGRLHRPGAAPSHLTAASLQSGALAHLTGQGGMQARNLAKDALFEDFKAAEKLNALQSEVQKTLARALPRLPSLSPSVYLSLCQPPQSQARCAPDAQPLQVCGRGSFP